MIGKSKIALLGAALGATAMLAAPAQSKDFDFSGKQVKLLIGFGFGGTYGKYSRMFAEHLKNHIPGNPNVIVESRPGAGGLLANELLPVGPMSSVASLENIASSERAVRGPLPLR